MPRWRRSSGPSARARSCGWARAARRADRGDPVGLARARPGARHRRAAARADHRDLRTGKLRQDHARAARDRRGAEARRHLRLHRCRACARPGLCAQARGGRGQPADQPAGRRRAGAGDLRHAGALGRDRRGGGGQRRRAGAAGRAGRRDGRQPHGPARAADEPGAAQAHRQRLAQQHDADLPQPDPHEDRRDVRQSGDHDRRQRAEVLCLAAPGDPAHRRRSRSATRWWATRRA